MASEYAGSLAYDAASESFTFTINLANPNEETYSQTFGPGDIVIAESDEHATVYERDGDRFVIAKPEGLGLSYVTSATWSSDDTFSTLGTTVGDFQGETVFGFRTELGDVPTVGQASYTLRVVGVARDDGEVKDLVGDGDLTADFALGRVETSLSIDSIDSSGGRTSWVVLSGPAQLMSGSAGRTKSYFVGRLGSSGVLPAGDYNGGFFGPQAKEVGGAFYVRTDSSGWGVGSFVGSTDADNAEPPAPNATLATLNASELFGARSATLVVNEIAGAVSPAPSLISEPTAVAYDAQTDTFKAPILSGSFATNVQAKGGVLLLAPDDVSSMGSDRAEYVAGGGRYVLFAPGQSVYALDYAAIGEWSDPDLALSASFALSNQYTVYGKWSADAPTAGGAVYDLAARGVHQTDTLQSALGGDGELAADFGAGTVDLNLDLWRVDGGGAVDPWHMFTTSAPGSISYPTDFDGAQRAVFGAPIVATDDAGLTGEIQGDFFGPAAEEVGGVFRLYEQTVAPAPGDPAVEAAAGAFVGARRP